MFEETVRLSVTLDTVIPNYRLFFYSSLPFWLVVLHRLVVYFLKNLFWIIYYVLFSWAAALK